MPSSSCAKQQSVYLLEEVFVTWKQPTSSDPTGHVAVFTPSTLAGQVSDTHVLTMEGVVCGVTFGCVVVCHTYHIVELCLSRVSDRMHGRKQGRKKPYPIRFRKLSLNCLFPGWNNNNFDLCRPPGN